MNPDQSGSEDPQPMFVDDNPVLQQLNVEEVDEQQQQMQQQMEQQMEQQLQQQQPAHAPLENDPTQARLIAALRRRNQPQQNMEFNLASLCKCGHDGVIDICNRVEKLFDLLKKLHLPNGSHRSAVATHKWKRHLQDQLMIIKVMFKRLRPIYEKVDAGTQAMGLEYTHIEGLIPMEEEWDGKAEEKTPSEAYQLLCAERQKIIEQLKKKNHHVKDLIDKLRRIVSEIDTMLSMRRS